MLPALLGQYDKPGKMMIRQAMGGKRRAFNVDKPKAPRIDGLGTKYPFAHGSGVLLETRDAMISGEPYQIRAGGAPLPQLRYVNTQHEERTSRR